MIQYKLKINIFEYYHIKNNEWQFLVETQNKLVYIDFTDTEYDINNCFCLVYY
jgi:hypothetical protein